MMLKKSCRVCRTLLVALLLVVSVSARQASALEEVPDEVAARIVGGGGGDEGPSCGPTTYLAYASNCGVDETIYWDCCVLQAYRRCTGPFSDGPPCSQSSSLITDMGYKYPWMEGGEIFCECTGSPHSVTPIGQPQGTLGCQVQFSACQLF